MSFDTSTILTAALLTLTGCDSTDAPIDFDDAGPDVGLEDEPTTSVEGAGLHSSTQPTSAFPGFGVEISVIGDDIELDWSATGPQGSAVSVFRATDPEALADEAALSDAGAEELVLPPGATSYVDVGAAAHDQATPTMYYRIVVDTGGSGGLSTMLMKKSTQMAPGYNKLGMCMLGGPTRASDLAAQLGPSVTAVWTWDAAGQSYVGWDPGQGVGTAADYSLPLGSVVSVQADQSTPAFQILAGTVPTDETFAVSGAPGINWSVLPALYGGPTSASYWVDTVGYWGMGWWSNSTQSASWYWDPSGSDFDVEPCEPYYTHLSDAACTSNADCSADTFCDFDEAAACGEVAAGLCKARPLGCEFSVGDEVCGCDGAAYANACEAAMAGASAGSAQACASDVDITVVADNAYMLWIDGVPMDAPNAIDWTQSDTFTATLAPGEHTIAIYLEGWGVWDWLGASVRVDGMLESQTGDGRWLVYGNGSRVPNTGLQDRFDNFPATNADGQTGLLMAAPSDWTTVGYDDGSWNIAPECADRTMNHYWNYAWGSSFLAEGTDLIFTSSTCTTDHSPALDWYTGLFRLNFTVGS